MHICIYIIMLCCVCVQYSTHNNFFMRLKWNRLINVRSFPLFVHERTLLYWSLRCSHSHGQCSCRKYHSDHIRPSQLCYSSFLQTCCCLHLHEIPSNVLPINQTSKEDHPPAACAIRSRTLLARRNHFVILIGK